MPKDLKRILHIIRHPYRTYEEHRVKEIHLFHKKSKGTPAYYVIRCDLPGCGWFAIYMYVLDHIAYAVDKGYIPVLKFGKYKCLYREDHAIAGTKQPWNYFYQPISTLDEARVWKLKNVVYGATKFPRYKGIYYYKQNEMNVLPSKERISELNELTEKYIHFNNKTKEHLENIEKSLFDFNKILGIHVRGTDMYTAGKQHPIPNEKNRDFSLIDSLIKKYQLDGIFLCSDTDSTIKMFREKYGDRLITTDAVRQRDDSQKGIHFDETLGGGRSDHKYKMGLEVITDMYLLSKCDVLVCGPSNVAFAAMIYNNNNYDKVYYLM